MNKILTVMLVSGLMLACNSKKEGSTTAEPVTGDHEHTGKTSGLALNNGAKWKADSTTILNVALLQDIVSGARHESVDSYVQTARQLESGLNKMVSECTMKGPDHEALHTWLEPLMEKTKELKIASSAENGAAVLNEIKKQVDLFPQYFAK